MTSTSAAPGAAPRPNTSRGPEILHRWSAAGGWRLAVGVTAIVAGAVTIAGCFLPWAEIFAGLVGVAGVRGLNGQMLAVAGGLTLAAGIWHIATGSALSRWVIGTAGAGILGFSGYLLLQLASSLRSLGGDAMVAARGGPGLWVVAAGGLVAFATMFLPASDQTTLRASADRGALRAWAADLTSAGPRRWLQIGLGVAWLLDAALQYQPYMFTGRFITQTLEPAGMGSPGIVSSSIMGTGQILLSHEVVFNAIFATIQLLLGAGLLWRRTVRAALAGTIIWALSIWWLGEGLGGLLTGMASPVTGAPGGALLYAFIAVLVWPSAAREAAGDQAGRSVATGSRLGSAAIIAWVVFWLGSAALLLQPANLARRALPDAIAGQADGEPRWIAAMDRGVAGAIGQNGVAVTVALAVIFVIIAAGLLVPRLSTPTVILAIVAAIAIGLVGQDLGGIFTGQGTDPGSGPLLILLAVAYLSQRTRNREYLVPE